MSKFYATGEMRGRAQAFDRIQSRAFSWVNQSFWSRASLGAYQNILLTAIENSFLPNVRDGVVTLPAEQRQTENIALVPIGSIRDRRLIVERSLLSPTPRKLEIIRARLGSDAVYQDTTKDLVGGRKQLIRNRRCGGATVRWNSIIQGETIAGRPAIFMRQKDRLGPYREPAVAIHEFTHGVDLTRWHLEGIDCGKVDDSQRLTQALEFHAEYVVAAFETYRRPIMTPRDYDTASVCRYVWAAENCSHDAMPRLSAANMELLGQIGLSQETTIV